MKQVDLCTILQNFEQNYHYIFQNAAINNKRVSELNLQTSLENKINYVKNIISYNYCTVSIFGMDIIACDEIEQLKLEKCMDLSLKFGYSIKLPHR